MKLKRGEPKDWQHRIFIVECRDYCKSGYAIARFDGEDWFTDWDDKITQYVMGWSILKIDPN